MRKSNTGTCNGMFRRFDVRNIFGNCIPAVAILLLSFLIGMTMPAYPVPKETLKNLVDENLLISAPFELHLTSVETPVTISTVTLNHEDAWLFFDNIKPSIVIEKYASNVLINGEQLQVGVNGRVAMYAHSTVMMSHASTFLPLTVYTEDILSGTSKQLSINTYHNNLGLKLHKL